MFNSMPRNSLLSFCICHNHYLFLFKSVGACKILWLKLMLTTLTVTENHQLKTVSCWALCQNKVTRHMTKFGLISYCLFWYLFIILEIPLVCLLVRVFQLCRWNISCTDHLALPKCFCNFTATASTQSATLLGKVFNLNLSQYLILGFKEYSSIQI